MTRRTTLLLVLILAFASAAAQQPRVTNAKLQVRSAAVGLEKEFRALVAGQVDPAWIGYAVPMVAGRHQMCCYSSDNCCGRCALEQSRTDTQQSSVTGQVSLEPTGVLLVLFRVEQRAVGKIRAFSMDCELDAGGLAFHWLTDVRPAESIALLAPFVTAPDPQATEREKGRISDGAVTAIALHADAAADRALEQFVGATQTDSVRRRAAFWLGAARGRRGFELLSKLAREDPSDRFREHAVFALSVSKEPQAVDVMIQMARGDASPRVRGQALFWLAHKAGDRVTKTITDALENDPETEVKRRAVFALSQLPKDQGVPLLIQVARTNKNAAVRKQAMFWLGQSKDQRALAFFEEMLTRH